MADTIELTAEQGDLITPYLPTSGVSPAKRPYVTLTYAQSLDSMISLGYGRQTALSGAASKSMTHFLRMQHDAILVGAATARVDDPSLNCRYPGARPETQPRPIIVGHMNSDWRSCGKAPSLAKEGKAKHPWTVDADPGNESEGTWKWDGDSLEMACDGNHQMEWAHILEALTERGIKSVMIEGGASVINHFLLRPELVDAVIITIAPMYLGNEGVRVSPLPNIDADGQSLAAGLRDTRWGGFGRDVVLCGRL